MSLNYNHHRTNNVKGHWGHAIWESIHTLAANYDGTSQAQRGFRSFISSLTTLLPCSECGVNLVRHLQIDLPLTDETFINRDTLFLWTYRLHDMVNREISQKRRIHKPSPAYQVVYNYYMGVSRCPHCLKQH